MRLKLIQLWCRATMRRPASAGLDLGAGHAAKPRQSYQDMAEQRRHTTWPIVLGAAGADTIRAGRHVCRVIRGLFGNDLLLDGGQ
jgi:hypothetical protein